MRCRWCNDILEMGEPTKEQLKLEDECPWKKNHKPWQICEEINGKEYAKAYKKMTEDYIKENLG